MEATFHRHRTPALTPDRLNVQRVLVAGDFHGNIEWATRVVAIAAEHDCPIILQLGDFGACWPGDHRQFEADLTVTLDANNVDLVFVAGNHEGWTELNSLAHDLDGLVTLTPPIRWVPNGTRWTWGGVSFGAMGGAYSVDNRYRTVGVDWWPDLELPTDGDLDRLGTDHVDVLVTHDTIDGAEPLRRRNLPTRLVKRARDVRLTVLQAAEQTTATLVIHGHWHTRQTRHILTNHGIIRVEGFASDIQGDQRAWGILYLPELAIGPPPSRDRH